MSKLSIIGLLIVIAAIGIFASTRYARISGNGNSATQNRTVTAFTKLKLDGVFKTVITQDGSAPSVRVEADENLQKTVIVKNEGETLTISTKENIRLSNPGSMTVYVNVKEISSIINSSVGNIENKGTLKAQALYLKSDAVGKTKLHISVDKLTADLSSVGATKLTGSATTAVIDNNSVGKLNAYELKTENLNIKNQAVGAVEICASKDLSIDHDGVGAVHYIGTAKVSKLNDNGVGKVTKED